MTAQDAEQTLLDQLLHQFKFSPNILKLLEILGNAFQDTFDAADFILTAVDLDDFAGEQLNFWGELVGVKRPRRQELRSNLFTLRARGEFLDPDNNTGFYWQDLSDTSGGYMTSRKGCPDQSDPSTQMLDADYRFLIEQKAQSFRSRMTHENLYSYLLAFGARCKLDGETTTFETVIDVQNYYDLNDWAKNYVIERGFAPAGLNVRFDGNLQGDKI